MGKDFDSDLSLRLGSGHHSSSADSNPSRSSSMADWFGNAVQNRQQQQQITIFYNGRICVCDVTEIQARAIICMAMREMNKRSVELSSPSQSRPSSPTEPLVPQLINPRLSMKRSLQRFLQKRKTRIDASSPYNNGTDEWQR